MHPLTTNDASTFPNACTSTKINVPFVRFRGGLNEHHSLGVGTDFGRVQSITDIFQQLFTVDLGHYEKEGTNNMLETIAKDVTQRHTQVDPHASRSPFLSNCGRANLCPGLKNRPSTADNQRLLEATKKGALILLRFLRLCSLFFLSRLKTTPELRMACLYNVCTTKRGGRHE